MMGGRGGPSPAEQLRTDAKLRMFLPSEAPRAQGQIDALDGFPPRTQELYPHRVSTSVPPSLLNWQHPLYEAGWLEGARLVPHLHTGNPEDQR